MNAQEQFWAGQFGDDYTKRNQVDWRARIPFWREIIEITGARSVHEFGCNAGWNLSAIRRAYPDVVLSGNDLNESALRQAEDAGHKVYRGSTAYCAELVFTAGVLIHIGPEELASAMYQVIGASHRYVLAIEYEDEKEVEVEYRGHAARLWRRPYGSMYEAMGLSLVGKVHNPHGFDNCTAWLLEKRS